MRNPLAWTLLLCAGMALVAACPRTHPPDEDPADAGSPADAGDSEDAGGSVDAGSSADAGSSCSPEPSGGAPWISRCGNIIPPDPCRQLVLPDAGPVPSAEAWAEESSRIRCAAWVDAGTLDPSVESACVEAEAQKWAGWIAEYDAGYRTYWPEAAWACLTGGGRPNVQACGCVFLRGEPGAPCGDDTHCREGYCLKGANGAGTCVQCPPRRPAGSTCGAPGQAPCELNTYCSAGCCVPGVGLGERCGGSTGVTCGPNAGYCKDACVEGCRGGVCSPYKQEGEICGVTPYCIPTQATYCFVGNCEQGLVCTYTSADPNSYSRCHPTGLHCNEQRPGGCGPNQICTGPGRLCVTLGSDLGPGEPCYRSSECAAGLQCLPPDWEGTDGGSSQSRCGVLQSGRCVTDTDCPWAQICVARQCMTPLGPGAACDSYSGDQYRVCGPYDTDMTCIMQADGGTCAPRPRIGERCVFTAPKPDGGTFQWSTRCAEGSCVVIYDCDGGPCRTADGYCR